MYGASLTKTVMAYTTLTLVDRGVIALDTPIAADLDQPLTSYDSEAIAPGKYGPYKDLASDDRWRRITPRMALTHSIGFRNFWFLEPDEKLRLHFDPGTRFSYSGEGFSLLQFVIENGRKAQGLGLDVGDPDRRDLRPAGHDAHRPEMAPRFQPQPRRWPGTTRAKPVEHDERSKVRAAGSMDTTIADLSKFVARAGPGRRPVPASRAEMVKPSLPIATAHQFPNLAPDLPVEQRRKDLAAGLGVVVFDGPQGRGFFKGGHDDQTANTMVCLERRQRCVLILSNDVRAEASYRRAGPLLCSVTPACPYDWEYGDHAGKS